jgi:hypothetical protein
MTDKKNRETERFMNLTSLPQEDGFTRRPKQTSVRKWEDPVAICGCSEHRKPRASFQVSDIFRPSL